jgi:hypothetical protein
MQIIAASSAKLPEPGPALNEFMGQLRREMDTIVSSESNTFGFNEIQGYAKNLRRLADQPTTTVVRGHLLRFCGDMWTAAVVLGDIAR